MGNGRQKLKLKHLELMMLLLKPQPSQITTIESMPGLIHNGRKTTQKNGRRKPLKLLKVDTTWLPREVTEFQETILFHWKLQRPQIITTYKMPGLMIKQKTWMKKVIIRKQQNHLSINQEQNFDLTS